MNKLIYRLMLAMLLCMVGVISASATNYISDIKLGIHDHSEATAKGYLTDYGYTVINVELNNNEGKSGEAWVFLGYKTTTDPSKAITGIMIISGGDSDTYLSGHIEGTDSYITFAGDSRKWYRCPSEGPSADINRFNGGDYLTIYYTRDNCVANGGSLLTALSATTSTGASGSGWTYSNMWKDGSISANGNTNYGTGGTSTYLIYQTHTHNFTYQQSTESQHIYGCAECGYVESTEDHNMTYNDNGDGKTHSHWCATCGYVITENHGEEYTDMGADYHTVYCPECGAVREDVHHFRGHNNYDGTHTRVCYFCGHAASPESHTFDYIDNNDGRTHMVYCSQCAYLETREADHTLVYTDNGDGTHTEKCSLCRYAVTHTTIYTVNGDGTHTASCSSCSYAEPAVSHTIVIKRNDDETHADSCTVCKSVINKSYHGFHITRNDDGTLTLYCPTCALTAKASYIYGDINKDGMVDITDVALLVKVLKGEAKATPICNVTQYAGDDDINVLDVDELRNVIIGKSCIHFVYEEETEESINQGGDNDGDDVSKTADVKARR